MSVPFSGCGTDRGWAPFTASDRENRAPCAYPNRGSPRPQPLEGAAYRRRRAEGQVRHLVAERAPLRIVAAGCMASAGRMDKEARRVFAKAAWRLIPFMALLYVVSF